MAARPVSHPLLERFIEARSAYAERASLRLGGETAAPDEAWGLSACHELSDVLDAAIEELGAPYAGPGFALVAIGGYGRREQCRHSDIDLMLLFAGEPPRETVDGVLYPLWDAALKVGHSVRTPEQATAAAVQNVETFTSLLDARLVAGDERLYGRFLRDRRKLVLQQQRWLRSELAEYRARLVVAEPWQLQQPDVKNGRGGLRELQATHWLTVAEAIASGAPEERPELPPDLEEARRTLLDIRTALHALDERPNDRYRQDLAAAVATLLDVPREELGPRMFASMRRIDGAAEAAFRPRPRRFALPWRRGASEHGDADGADGGGGSGASDSARLMAALEAAEAGGLEPLPPAPWLERLLPEWEMLRCLSHIAPFHRHPVDVHVWRTVAEARRAVTEDEDGTETPEVAAGLAHPEELLLGALLHDIGKGHEGDHSEVGAVIVEHFGARAGLDDEAVRRLAAVTRHHLLLPTVATRRDIADVRVIGEVAEAVGDTDTLDLLYLISVADARATGPDVWSAWKAQLMHSLYVRVREELAGDADAAESATARRRQEIVEALGGEVAAERVLAHLDGLPPGYALSTTPETVAAHLALIERADGGTALEHDRVGEVERLTLVTPDRPGLLSAVAGALAVHNVLVLGGTAHTRDDGVAIEVMYLGDALGRGLDERRWQRVLEAVPQAVEGGFAIDERLAETRRAYAAATPPPADIPTTVHVDNGASEEFSIVEVHAADRLGLLYAITAAMLELQMDIHLAKVDTIGREVVDSFYVQRRNGRRVEEADEIERLVRRVAEAVAALDEVRTGG